MNVSTESTVRDVILRAMRSCAADLGIPESQIRDYFLDYEEPELITKYLLTDINARKESRAWAVQVLPALEAPRAVTGNAPLIFQRVYDVQIRGYYSLGVAGSGSRLIVDHARRIRAAIFALGQRLEQTTDIYRGSNPLSVDVLDSGDGENGRLLVASIGLTYETGNGNF